MCVKGCASAASGGAHTNIHTCKSAFECLNMCGVALCACCTNRCCSKNWYFYFRNYYESACMRVSVCQCAYVQSRPQKPNFNLCACICGVACHYFTYLILFYFDTLYSYAIEKSQQQYNFIYIHSCRSPHQIAADFRCGCWRGCHHFTDTSVAM